MASRTDIYQDQDRGRSWGQRDRPMAPVSPTKARQGAYGRPVLYVLVGGLLLAALAWVGAEWWGSATAPENPANQPPAAVAPGSAETEPAPPMAGQTSPENAPIRP